MPVSVHIEGGLEKLLKDLESGKRVCAKAGFFDPHYATIATYLENGWVQRITPRQRGWFAKNYGVEFKRPGYLSMPPRPFLAATLRAEGAKWAALARAAYCKELNLYKVYQAVGGVMANDIKSVIARAGTDSEKFENRHPLTLFMYSKDADAPVETTGKNGAIKFQKVKHGMNGSANNTTAAKPLTRTGGMMQSVTFKIGAQ